MCMHAGARPPKRGVRLQTSTGRNFTLPGLLSSAMPLIPRARPALLAVLGVAAVFLLHAPSQARANTGQIEMFQDDPRVLANPARRCSRSATSGGGVVRVSLQWNAVAPLNRPAGFNATDPASYPGWAIYDEIVTDARQDGITVDFSIGGPAPLWAIGSGQPSPAACGEMEALRRRLQAVRAGGRHPLQRHV